MKYVLPMFLIVVAASMFGGCSRSEPTPDTTATETAIAQKIFATLTASAPTATSTPHPTAISAIVATATPVPQLLPAIATPTEKPTVTLVPATPTSTASPEPTPTATPSGPVAVVAVAALNVRKGPGTVHPIIDSVRQDDQLEIVGRNEDGSWLEVITPSGANGWVAASLIVPDTPVNSIELAAVIPTPPAPTTATPVPRLARLHERQLVGTWEIQPERVHKEKAVYWYGDDYIAMGNYAIVIVLAKNLSPGTDVMA